MQDCIDTTLVIATTCRLNPPVAALARAWFGRVPMAVASNAKGVVVQAMLRACALGALFDPVVSLSEAGVAIPDPKMFLMAAGAMGVAAGDRLVLEDSNQGMSAAVAAGMAAVNVRVQH